MAYSIKKNILKDGSITYGIFEVNRVPGKGNRFETRCVEKFNSTDLAGKGISDHAGYAEERLSEWKERLERDIELHIILEQLLHNKLSYKRVAYLRNNLDCSANKNGWHCTSQAVIKA